jgi:hypothetical protein
MNLFDERPDLTDRIAAVEQKLEKRAVKDNELMLDEGDVYVLPLENTCDECGERPITHHVQIDLRTAGQASSVGMGCEPCMEELANRIREGLPEATE